MFLGRYEKLRINDVRAGPVSKLSDNKRSIFTRGTFPLFLLRFDVSSLINYASLSSIVTGNALFWKLFWQKLLELEKLKF